MYDSKFVERRHLFCLNFHRFVWKRTSFVLGHSTFDVYWDIPTDIEMGNYRIRHFGYARHILGGIYAYMGSSKQFTVVN